MNHSTQENQPELLDRLCQAIAAEDVPTLASEPLMPWEQGGAPIGNELTDGAAKIVAFRSAKDAVTDATFAERKAAIKNSQLTSRDNVCNAENKEALAHLTSWRGRGLTMCVVAAIVLLCGFLVSGLPSGNSAFAQVQEAASKIRSVRFRTLLYEGDRDPKVTSIVILSGVGGRSDSSDGVEVVSDYKNGKELSLDHRSKSAVLVQTFGAPPSLDQLWRGLLELPSEKVKKLEPGTMDGKKIDRFEVQENGSESMIVSVDPSTNLPVRMEREFDNGGNGNNRHRFVATDFIFNSAVEPSLLSTTPPSEYHLTESSRPSSRKQFRESDLIVSPETGIGGVALGSSKEEVVAKLGQPDSIRETHIPGREITNPDNTKTKLADTNFVKMLYPSEGFDLRIGLQGLKSIDCYGKQLRGVMAQDFVGKTDAGIKLGATKGDVITKHGQPDVQSGNNPYGELLYIRKGYRFIFVEGKLAFFTVSAPMPKEIEVIDKGNGSFELRDTGNE